MTDNKILKAKAHFEYGIKYDIFKEPVLSYAKTVLEAFDEINRQKAEIERLQADNSSMQSTLAKMSMGVEEAKAEAIKEFAQSVKDLAYKKSHSDKEIYAWYEDIDNLVKEMVGDTE